MPALHSESLDQDDPLSLENTVRELQNDPVFLGEAILAAAGSLNHEKLDELLRNGSANVRDPSSGLTPIHAAVGSFDSLADGTPPDHEVTDEVQVDRLETTLKVLFLNGAIWNDLSPTDETPGDVAARLGLKGAYQLIVDAGVRAELLLAAMSEYQEIEDDDEDGDSDGEVQEKDNGEVTVEIEPDAYADVAKSQTDAVSKDDVNSRDYLASTLRFTSDRILDSEANAVMMAWEKDIMKRSANLLVPSSGLRVLNVGAGMSIIDNFFQEKTPKTHHIIEAHPEVISRLKADGWPEKAGVTIHEGRWQDVVTDLMEQNVMFDAIYFDTFAEDYSDLREFFSEHVIQLLDPSGGQDGEGGAFGFFHGLGADRQVCYDVYTQVRSCLRPWRAI
jgi:type IV protein arginine methyltransferase